MARIPFQAGAPKNFTPVPKGTYCLEIESVEEKTSKNNNPMIEVTQIIQDHPTYAGRKIKRWFTLTANAGFRAREFLEALLGDKVDVTENGQTDENGEPLFDIDFDTDDLIGLRYYSDAIIRHNKERGEDQNDWKNDRLTEKLDTTGFADGEGEGEGEGDEEGTGGEGGEEGEGEDAEAAEETQARTKTQQLQPGKNQAAQGKGQGKPGSGSGSTSNANKGTQAQGKGGNAGNGGKSSAGQSTGRERTRLRA